MILRQKFFILINFIVLLFYSTQLSISYKEIITLESYSILSWFVNIFLETFGVNDFILRLPMILLHISSTILIFLISKENSFKFGDAYFSTLFFTLLPGVISASLVVNDAGLTIFLLLLFIYLHYRVGDKAMFILLFYLLVNSSFILLYISLFVYFLYQKDKNYSLFALLLIVIDYHFYGFDIGGHPNAYILDTLAAYGAVMSPFIFLYYIYAVYRVYIKEEKNIFWFITTIPFLVSLFLSLRQPVAFELFAPYLVIAIPLMSKIFIRGYRVRLKMFRTSYKWLFVFLSTTLIISTLLIYLNKFLYPFLENKEKHFLYKYHIAKELANKLHKLNINSIGVDDIQLQKRLTFYGIDDSNNYILSHRPISKDDKNVTISYNGIKIVEFYVSNINN